MKSFLKNCRTLLISILIGTLLGFAPPVQAEDIVLHENSDSELNLYANVVNIVNTNLSETDITRIFRNFDSLSTNIVLSNDDATSHEIAASLLDSLCSETICKGIESYKFIEHSDLPLTNSVDLSATTGSISLTGATAGESITTPSARAVANILNIVDTNASNSHITITAINVFGDWKGDLILPKHIELADQFISQNSPYSTNNSSQVQNDVIVDATSGNNVLDATSSLSDGGSAINSAIKTGEASSIAQVHNIANQTIANGQWYIGLINTFGTWNGDALAVPDNVALQKTSHGLMYSSSSTNTNAFQTLADAQSSIINSIALRSITGNNKLLSSQIDGSSITTGNSVAALHLLNFANLNLQNVNLNVSLVTVFGSWSGNIVFGDIDDALQTNQNNTTTAVLFDDGVGTLVDNTRVSSVPQTANQFDQGETLKTNAIEIIKTNDAPVRGIQGGNSVTFTLTIHNIGAIDFENLIVYDKLIGPDGTILSDQTIPLGNIAQREQIELSYTVDVPQDAILGMYHNGAYAEVYNPLSYRKLISNETAQSSFRVDSTLVPGPVFTLGEVRGASVSVTRQSIVRKKTGIANGKRSLVQQVEAENVQMPMVTGRSIWQGELDSLRPTLFFVIIFAIVYVANDRNKRRKEKPNIA